MLLKSDDQPIGIRCDLTGDEVYYKFVYYSIGGKKINVNTATHTIQQDSTDVDFDITDKGFDLIKESIIKNQRSYPKNTIKCDITGKILSGKFSYYKLKVSQITVNIEQYVNYNQTAIKNVEDNILELDISEEAIDQFIKMKSEQYSKPFDSPKPKKPVIKIPAPKPKLEPESKPKLESKPEPKLEPKLESEPIQQIDEPKPQQYVRVPGLQRYKPTIQEPIVEFEVKEIEKKKLPNTGTRRNIKRRKDG